MKRFSRKAFIVASALLSPLVIGANLSQQQAAALAKQYGIQVDGANIDSLSQSKSATQGQTQKQGPTIKPRSPVGGGQANHAPAAPGIKPFGYNLFAGSPTSATPLTDLPVPDDYIVGPGDELRIQIYGKANALHTLKVSNKGQIDFPNLGPIYVAGKQYQQVAVELIELIKKKILGVDVFVSMGELRLMQITVTGDAWRPGAYNLNALTTVTQALQAAGGIAATGSLRNVQVRRNNHTIQQLDLYDLLLKGDNSDDIRLRAGDVVHIPAKAAEVAIKGLVRRPAIFEPKGKQTLAGILELAGGLKPEAVKEVKLTRNTETGVQITNLKLGLAADRAFPIKDGDLIEALQASSEFTDGVLLKGAAIRPGPASYKPGMRISQLIQSADKDLKLNADQDYALIVRERPGSLDIDLLQFSLRKALANKGSDADLRLQKRDQVLIFAMDLPDQLTRQATAEDKKLTQGNVAANQRRINQLDSERQDQQTGASVEENTTEESNVSLRVVGQQNAADEATQDSREALLAPVLQQLRQQATPLQPVQIAEVAGEVKFAGTYPIPTNASLNDLLLAAGGAREPAARIELSRYQKRGNELKLGYQTLQLTPDGQIQAADNSLAQSKDRINVLTKPEWREEVTVQLQGEVLFPGNYTVRRGETLSQLLRRVGGLTPFANPSGAIFARESLRKQEQERLKRLGEQLRAEIAAMSIRRTNQITGTIDPNAAMKAFNELEHAEALGRQVIGMQAILNGQSEMDILLENKDKLYIPPRRNVVSVMGEVQHISNHTYEEQLTIRDYLERAGGAKKMADTSRTYVIRADGSVRMPSNSWFSTKRLDIEPGDTIVVPIDADYIDNISVISSITQLMYQLGVAWAAIKN